MVSNQKTLQGLNPEQKKAVTHKLGPLLIIAGAGTGKTTVITRRIAWLIAQKLAKPGEILALTFTDKAAEAMEGKVDLLVPYGYIDVSISTFHAFGDRVLRDYAIDLGLRPDYRVISKPEQLIFFREHIFEFPLHYYKSLGDPTKHIEALIGAISRAKDEDISPEEYITWAKKIPKAKDRAKDKDEVKKQLEVAQIYKKYQELKAAKGLIDFGDQVNLTLKLFRERPAILKEYQQRYKYILVDEFQDTNYAQFQLLRLLAGKKRNITAVGDDDQSIYKFRGAAISNILSFQKVYKKAKKVVLTRNYRSTQTILDSAYRLIKHNDPERLEIKAGVDKKLISCVQIRSRDVQSQAPFEKMVEHRQFDRVTSEADWVARTIKEKLEAKDCQLKDFAILVRANADAEPFRQSLNMFGLPHQFSGGGGLYSFPEVKLIVSFLRVIGDPADSVSLYSLALSELYQLDPLELQKINVFASRRNLTLHHLFAHLEESAAPDSIFNILADISEPTRGKIKQIMADIAYYLDFARSKSSGEVLYKFLKRSGYLEKLMREQSVGNDSRINNIARLFEKIREFKELAEVDRVAEFVKYLNIMKEAGDDPESAAPDLDVDAVNVLTVHKAKGLEWPVVFMVALVADKFPARGRKQAIELPTTLIKEPLPEGDFVTSEERRLFYVGMTRAARELYLTSAVDYGGKRDRKVSQFVLEALDLPKVDMKIYKQSAISQIELFAPSEPLLPGERQRGAEEIIHLSHYQIDDYLTCPLKYKYVHVLRVPLLPNHQIIYGSAIHQAVQAYYSAKKGRRRFSLKQLIEVFHRHWSAEGFISRQHEEQRLAAGEKALSRFYKGAQASKRVPKYIEEEFTILENKVQIKGRWDLVESWQGQDIIVDFKSSEVKTQAEADKRAKASLQLKIYALAWQRMFGRLPSWLELRFIETGLVGSTKVGAKERQKAWEEINEVAEGIRQANFAAKPSSFVCGYCAYREICPKSAA